MCVCLCCTDFYPEDMRTRKIHKCLHSCVCMSVNIYVYDKIEAWQYCVSCVRGKLLTCLCAFMDLYLKCIISVNVHEYAKIEASENCIFNHTWSVIVLYLRSQVWLATLRGRLHFNSMRYIPKQWTWKTYERFEAHTHTENMKNTRIYSCVCLVSCDAYLNKSDEDG